MLTLLKNKITITYIIIILKRRIIVMGSANLNKMKNMIPQSSSSRTCKNNRNTIKNKENIFTNNTSIQINS